MKKLIAAATALLCALPIRADAPPSIEVQVGVICGTIKSGQGAVVIAIGDQVQMLPFSCGVSL